LSIPQNLWHAARHLTAALPLTLAFNLASKDHFLFGV